VNYVDLKMHSSTMKFRVSSVFGSNKDTDFSELSDAVRILCCIFLGMKDHMLKLCF